MSINYHGENFRQDEVLRILPERHFNCCRIFSYDIKKMVFTKLTADLIFAIQKF